MGNTDNTDFTIYTSESSSFIDRDGTIWRDTSGKWTKDDSPINEIEEIPPDENVQKEIDKIGIPGKRTIDDLLASFKVVKDPRKKLSAIEQLEDETWMDDAFVSSKEPKTEIPSEPKGT